MIGKHNEKRIGVGDKNICPHSTASPFLQALFTLALVARALVARTLPAEILYDRKEKQS
jgi:hypothetical protein